MLDQVMFQCVEQPDCSRLFRFCLAVQDRDKRAAKCHRNEAISEFVEMPDAYSLVWAPFLPDNFVRETLQEQGIIT